MGRKKTNEEFVNEVYDLVGDEYTFLEEYDGAKAKIKCKHNVCNYIYEVEPSNFLSGRRCPKCMEKQSDINRRKTNDEFIREVQVLVGNEYIFLEEYIDVSIKIKCRHNKCGHTWYILPSNFLKGRRCPKCSRVIQALSQTKTNQEFSEEVYDLTGNEYIFLEKYVNAKTKIICKHNECGCEWLITPHSFLSGTRCPQCTRIKANESLSLTYEDVKYFIEVESNSGCKLLSEKYVSNATKMSFKCYCGNEFTTTFSKFKDRGKMQCNPCGRENGGRLQSIAREDFVRELHEVHGVDYSIIGEYKSKSQKLLVRHNTCGYEWYTTPNNLIGYGVKKPATCPECSNSRKDYTIEDIKIKLAKIDSNIKILSKVYVNQDASIECKCLIDGYVWTTTWKSLNVGTGCPVCNFQISKGERKVADILDGHKVRYKKQKTFEDCRYRQPLKFDFYLPNNHMCIEVDGEQHFRPVNFGGCSDEESLSNFKSQQIRDDIKNQYCKDNNIPLLRIPYWEFENIEQIIEDYLEQSSFSTKEIV